MGYKCERLGGVVPEGLEPWYGRGRKHEGKATRSGWLTASLLALNTLVCWWAAADGNPTEQDNQLACLGC